LLNKKIQEQQQIIEAMHEQYMDTVVAMSALIHLLVDKEIVTFEEINGQAAALQRSKEARNNSAGRNNKNAPVLRVVCDSDTRQQVPERDTRSSSDAPKVPLEIYRSKEEEPL